MIVLYKKGFVDVKSFSENKTLKTHFFKIKSFIKLNNEKNTIWEVINGTSKEKYVKLHIKNEKMLRISHP